MCSKGWPDLLAQKSGPKILLFFTTSGTVALTVKMSSFI